MMLNGMESSFGHLGSAVQVVSPPKFLPTISLLTGGTEWEREKALMLCNYCSAIAASMVCCQHCFSHKSETEPPRLLQRKLTLSQPDPAHQSWKLS